MTYLYSKDFSAPRILATTVGNLITSVSILLKNQIMIVDIREYAFGKIDASAKVFNKPLYHS